MPNKEYRKKKHFFCQLLRKNKLELDSFYCPQCGKRALIYLLTDGNNDLFVRLTNFFNEFGSEEIKDYVDDERTHICLNCEGRFLITEM